MLALRDNQQEVKRKVYQEIRGGKKRVVVQAMTSFGKTALAASIVLDCLEKGHSVIFTAPLLTLVEQTIDEFVKFGIPKSKIGVVQADNPLKDFSRPVQICSIQSLAAIMRRDKHGWLKYCDGKMLIHDETHLLYKAHMMMNEAASMPVIGLSATPWRKGLGKYYDSLVHGQSTRELIDNGDLCDYVAYSHYIPDLKGISTSNGDFNAQETGDKYGNTVIGDIVQTWMKHAEGKKTILFAPRVVDAERFAAEFRHIGFNAVSVNGYMDQEDCAKEIERFRNSDITILCSVAKLATGFSVKDVECIIDAQPTKSLMRHIQKLGRGLRTHPDKDKVIILDNAGNLIRNGLPDGTYPQVLDDGKTKVSDRRDKKEPEPKQCSKCNYIKPPRVHECPSCGHKPKQISQLEIEKGELRLLKGKELNRKAPWDYKITFMSGLKTHAHINGYSHGWVSHTYRDKFGVWPNDPKLKQAPKGEVTEDVQRWIKYKQLKYALGRQKGDKRSA